MEGVLYPVFYLFWFCFWLFFVKSLRQRSLVGPTSPKTPPEEKYLAGISFIIFSPCFLFTSFLYLQHRSAPFFIFIFILKFTSHTFFFLTNKISCLVIRKQCLKEWKSIKIYSKLFKSRSCIVLLPEYLCCSRLLCYSVTFYTYKNITCYP